MYVCSLFSIRSFNRVCTYESMIAISSVVSKSVINFFIPSNFFAIIFVFFLIKLSLLLFSDSQILIIILIFFLLKLQAVVNVRN